MQESASVDWWRRARADTRNPSGFAEETVGKNLWAAQRFTAGAHCPTCTFLVEALQLLVSLISLMAFLSSAQARMKYWPRAVLLGTVTLVEVPAEVPPAASAGTERLPVSSLSPPFLELSIEK